MDDPRWRTDLDRAEAVARACAEWAQARGWTVSQRAKCASLLDNPRHRCASSDCFRYNLDRIAAPGCRIDHPVLLRRGPAGCPTQWAILSQNYGPEPVGDPHYVGIAPYNETWALLYVGRWRPDDRPGADPAAAIRSDPLFGYLGELACRVGKPVGDCTAAELLAAGAAQLAAARADLDRLAAAAADHDRCGMCPVTIPSGPDGRRQHGRARVTHTCHLAHRRGTQR